MLLILVKILDMRSIISYKEGRRETPEDLKVQMPYARKILEAMGIKHYEVENFEADDIIGTIASMADKDPEFDATIVSSDETYYN